MVLGTIFGEQEASKRNETVETDACRFACVGGRAVPTEGGLTQDETHAAYGVDESVGCGTSSYSR